MRLSSEVVVTGRAEIEALDLRMTLMQAEYADLQARRNAWVVILGEDANPSTEPSASSVEDGKETLSVDETDLSALGRKVIENTGERGFKPKDIRARLIGMGRKVHNGFTSNLLFRMKRKGEVVEHSGRYYLPKFDPKPRLNMSPLKDQGATEVTP